jgi:hypothetical protein
MDGKITTYSAEFFVSGASASSSNRLSSSGRAID